LLSIKAPPISLQSSVIFCFLFC